MSDSNDNLINNNIDEIDAQSYRIANNIKCIGSNIPEPIYSFAQHKWPPQIYSRLKELKFHTPTPVQAQTLPIIMQTRDLLGIARSGSGKTLCFVLPALACALNWGLSHWPTCLVLTPTRELTHQVERVVKKFRFARSICLYGGVSRNVQMMYIRDAKPHIIIATPGRLYDNLERAITHLNNIKYLVIDEADRMLEMSQDKPFEQIMKLLPQKRQTLMFSATWPDEVKHLADQYLKKDHCQVIVGSSSTLSLTVNPNIKQIIDVCDGFDKPEKLLKCLEQYSLTPAGHNKTIIFVRSSEVADDLVRFLKKNDIFSRALHGKKNQEERNYVVREFNKNKIPIILSTDIGARGLDFDNLKLVVNYDYPRSIEEYIHRIGRTARHNTKGTAYTLFTLQNSHHVNDLIKVLQDSGQEINPQLINIAEDYRLSTENNMISDTSDNDLLL